MPTVRQELSFLLSFCIRPEPWSHVFSQQLKERQLILQMTDSFLSTDKHGSGQLSLLGQGLWNSFPVQPKTVFSDNWNSVDLAIGEVSKALLIRNETYTFKGVQRGSLDVSSASFPHPPISEQTSRTSTLWLWEFQLGVSDGSLQQPYPKGNTCKSL